MLQGLVSRRFLFGVMMLLTFSVSSTSEIPVFSAIPWRLLDEDTVVPHPIRSGWVEDLIESSRGISLEEACHFEQIPPPSTDIRFEIFKSQFVLLILAKERVVKAYAVSLSGNPIGHKTHQGDKKTPEGRYKIMKHISPSYGRCFYVCYPNRADGLRAFLTGEITYTQFRRIELALEQRRPPPRNTPLGAQILIHTAQRSQDTCATCENWSLGCIVMEPDDLEELLAVTRWFQPNDLTIFSVDIELDPAAVDAFNRDAGSQHTDAFRNDVPLGLQSRWEDHGGMRFSCTLSQLCSRRSPFAIRDISRQPTRGWP